MGKIVQKYKNLPIQIRASFWFLICSFMQKGISIITTPVFTRLMSTSEYGQYGVFNSWLSIITVFVTAILYQGMYVRGLVKYSNERGVFSSALQGLCLILTIVWTLIYLLFHQYINRITSLTTVQMLAMLVMIWSTASFSFWAAEKRVVLDYKSLVLLTVFASIAKPAIGIILVVNANDKVTARILGLVLVELVAYTGCFVVQMKRGKKFYSGRYWKEAMLFNIPLIPHYLSMSILNGADKIMIEKMVGQSEAGIYSVAYSLSQIMKLFNTALTQTIEPWLYKQIKMKRLKDIGRIAYPTWAGIALINLLLIACAPEVVRFFAPETYYDAIWIVPPVAMSVYFIFLYSYFAVFEFYFAKTKIVAVATCAGAVLNILLNYFFIKLFGYLAAGYTTLACYVVYSVMHYLFMVRICKNEGLETHIYSMKLLVGLSATFMLAGFGLLLTYRHPIIRYSCIALFIVVGYIFKRRILYEIKNIVSIRKK